MSLKRAFINSLLLITLACSTINVFDGRRIVPKHKGVDPAVQPMVEEWLNLAKLHGLKFKNAVAVGFEDMDHGAAIGVTEYGLGFREIGLDATYWKFSSTVSRLELIYHELTHAYCNRDHDFAKGKMYGKNDIFENWHKKKDGFFDDGCPISLMYPTAIEDSCMLSHYTQYVDEMYQRCETY